MEKIAIIGCGLIGSSWCVVFARAGHEVRLYDAAPGAAEAARKTIAEQLPTLARQGLLNDQDPDAILARLTVTSTLAEAVAGADYIQENAPERLPIKIELYKELDGLVGPNAIIASSTSGFPSSAFTKEIGCRNRCLVSHPLNPPHLIPLVEIVPAEWTDKSVVGQVDVLMKAIGQSPIKLNREINGFIVNRLQSAVLAEAFRLLDDDVCGVGDVDAAMADGLGMRWFFIGPFETIDLNAPAGVADYCAKLGPMFMGLANEQLDPRVWTEGLVKKIEAQRRQFVAADKLGARRAWRDKSLAEYVTAKKRVIKEYGA